MLNSPLYGQFEANLKQGLARTQGEDEGVTVLLFLRDRIRLERLPSRSLSRGLRDPRSFGQVELEVLVVHLGARRIGSVVHREQAGALQFVPLRLKTHDVGGDADVVELFGYVEDLHFDRVRPRRRHAVVGHALVNGANQMRARVRKLEAEVAAGVSLGARQLLPSPGPA